MGTLYECLREARLEQFYPAFRANGITRSEALINLGMPEFCALGITASEDKRRLIELVTIIKSVHSTGLSDSPVLSRRNTSSNNSSSASGQNNNNERGSSHNPSRIQVQANRGCTLNEQSGSRSQQNVSTRQTQRDMRLPNFSAASYMDMLEYMSDGSESEGDHSNGEEQHAVVEGPPALMNVRNIASSSVVRASSSTVRASTSRTPIERIKHSQDKGYNYGVHTVNSPTKGAKSSRLRHTGDERIKVCVRKRPVTRREQRAKEEDIVMVESTNTLIVNEPKLAVDLKAYTLEHEYIFDEVFDESCSNEDVYIRAARPLISCIFTGGTATCFAYGQTGAGKTHTMLGYENIPGLYLLAGQDIFSIIQSEKYGKGLHVWVSFFEIYCGQLFDLLNRRNRLHAREDGSRQVCIAGLTETEATDLVSLVQTLDYGNSVRSKGATGVNPDSSRSHAILQLDIRDEEDIKIGKMSFIDLAGSERASDVKDTDKQTRQEGAEINQSLLALKECIRSIDQESRHTPFRQSKLTHILKDSFIGNSRTCMIANISPTQTACENTLNTLRYADRVKELKRDSVRTSSAVGQAMNLLMNIPPTAPTIFHPSNIQSSSTPLRQSTQSRRVRPPDPVEIDLDPSETPIRGHNLPRVKSTIKEKSYSSSGQTQTASSRSQHLNDPSSAASSIAPRPSHNLKTSVFKQAADTAASQGAENPPPDASPSESDHTDTDSCNVTNPTYTLKGVRKPLVVRSTDTEFDFPTSDFNNIDEFNDLNRSNPQQQGFSEKSDLKTATHAASDPLAASAGNAFSPRTTDCYIKPAPFKSPDITDSTTKSSTKHFSPKISEVSHKFQSTSDFPSPLQSKHNPSFKKPFMTELISSDDSIEDGEMFADGPQSSSKPTNNLSQPCNKPVSSAGLLKSQMMVPQPAESSDLAKFTQRQLPSVPELVPKSAATETKTEKKSDIPHESEHLSTDVGQKSNLSYQTSQCDLSPGVKFKQFGPVASPHSPSQPTVQSSLYPSPNSTPQSPALKSQPPLIAPNQPPTHLKSKSPTSHNIMSNESPGSHDTTVEKSSPEACKSSDPIYRSRRNSEGSDTKRRRRRVSHSPTGQVSDDSTDSIRASMSDQGQSGNRQAESQRGRMRKEWSDPMLALDLQKKKHTLPDSENITKMLNRGNNSKSGLTQGLSGWKVVHNELPSNPHHTPSSHLEGQGRDFHEYQPKSSAPEQLVLNRIHNSREKIITDDGSVMHKYLPQPPTHYNSNDKTHSSHQTQRHQSYNDKQEHRETSNKQPVIVQEKLVPGGTFSPIHPQPTVVSTTPLQPKPVTVTTDINDAESMALDSSLLASLQEERMHLVSAHEDQLASVTSLCRYEMRLLLNAKKLSGKKGFDDYLRRVNDILQQKMTAITLLQEKIFQYRSNNQSSSVTASYQTSASESSSCVSTGSHLLLK